MGLLFVKKNLENLPVCIVYSVHCHNRTSSGVSVRLQPGVGVPVIFKPRSRSLTKNEDSVSLDTDISKPTCYVMSPWGEAPTSVALSQTPRRVVQSASADFAAERKSAEKVSFDV